MFDALSLPARERLRPYVERVQLSKGKVLYDIGELPRHVLMPQEGLISLLAITEDGDTLEVAHVCNDGIAGVPIVLSAKPPAHQAVVQIPGVAYRIHRDAFVREFRRGEELQALTLICIDTLIRQQTQSALCHAFHPLMARVCRWLLTSRDCLHANTVELTEESIAHTLGVSRPRVSQALVMLEQQNLIHHGHGRTHIVDAQGLARMSCTCYRATSAQRDSQHVHQAR